MEAASRQCRCEWWIILVRLQAGAHDSLTLFGKYEQMTGHGSTACRPCMNTHLICSVAGGRNEMCLSVVGGSTCGKSMGALFFLLVRFHVNRGSARLLEMQFDARGLSVHCFFSFLPCYAGMLWGATTYEPQAQPPCCMSLASAGPTLVLCASGAGRCGVLPSIS